MTNLTAQVAAAPAARTWAERLRNAIRLHVANPWPTLITPWMVFTLIFLLNLAIWAAVTVAAGGRDKLEPDAFASNGGAGWVFFYLCVIAVQAMNLTFSFALGLGMTRRDYYVGTMLYFTALSLSFAVGITALAEAERRTDGWGFDAKFFTPFGLDELSPLALFGAMAMIALLFMCTGALIGSVWVRWRAWGIYGFVISLAVVVVAVVWAITALDGWGAVGDFFDGRSFTESLTLTLPLTVAAGVGGFFVLRRATPK